MLVDLSKIEIKTIIEALHFQMVESESLDDFNDKENEAGPLVEFCKKELERRLTPRPIGKSDLIINEWLINRK